MTRLELATPTLARLCATNCATSAFPDRSGHSCNFSRQNGECKTTPRRACHTGAGSIATAASGSIVNRSHGADGRLAQLVARFLHTEEVISSSLVSPTTQFP